PPVSRAIHAGERDKQESEKTRQNNQSLQPADDGPRLGHLALSSRGPVHPNQSSPMSEFPSYSETINDPGLLVSPLLVAGVVIGLVLFLSCMTIIVGGLRKERRLRRQNLSSAYAPDSFSFGDSIGELRSTCFEEFPPDFDFESFLESQPQPNVMYSDLPPRYDECVGPGAMQIPTDDPPPYSLTDPGQRIELPVGIGPRPGMALGEPEWASNSPGCRPGGQPPVSAISRARCPLETVPPYEMVVRDQSRPIPLMPRDAPKNSNPEYLNLFNRII
ncbi:protein BEAN1, partial [Tachyglossus aculeatus]|uniref:protein BEAN1 n=1 Tax=Tachyglossus aculeatus TaxID=9261 RepID=UPI0018F51310